MTLIYTTIEAIARRLRGRLKIPTASLSPLTPPNSLGQQVVDADLIADIGSQVEQKISMILGQIYVMPLHNQHPIIAGIVERMVIADIMLTHYQNSVSPELGGDPGFGGIMFHKAQEDLLLLTAGHNIALPGVPTPPQVPGVMTPQPIVLPGEVLQSQRPDTVTRNVTVVGKSNIHVDNARRLEWGIDWEDGRALGAEPLVWWGRECQ